MNTEVMHNTLRPASAVVEKSNERYTLVCAGQWSASSLSLLEQQHAHTDYPQDLPWVIDLQAITSIDTAGIWLLTDIEQHLRHQQTVTLQGLTTKQQRLYEVVNKERQQLPQPAKIIAPHFVAVLGQETLAKCRQLCAFLAFFGELVVVSMQSARHPRRLAWHNFAKSLELMGYHALPIIGLLTFLIGVVLAYQMGLQLENYGANIFIVDVAGLSIFREFGPLITAIIIAGRTGSALTARFGTMKVNEEIDVIKVMGLSPMQRLVIPEVLSLLIAVPLLTVWADIFGIIGSMLMAKNMLDIHYIDFLLRFSQQITVKTFMVGLIKAPVFGLLIVIVGCFQGFRVSANAESVGQHTTKSVVQAIFLIIIADAIFSVIFNWLDI